MGRFGVAAACLLLVGLGARAGEARDSTRAHAPAARVGEAAPAFELKDQFDHATRLADLKGSLVLIICGDRLGGDYMNDWARQVAENYKDAPDAVTVLRVADLFAVPPFFHSFVKHKFLAKNAEGRTAKPTLLDWEGSLAELYGFTENLTNVYVIDAQGVLRYKASGKGTPEEVHALILALEDVRRQPAAANKPERKTTE